MEVSNYITSEVLEKLYVCFSFFFKKNLIKTKKSKEAKLFEAKKEYSEENETKIKNDDLLEGFLELGGNVNYTDIPKRKLNYGIIGENLTKMNFDKSMILKEILQKEYQNNYKFLFGEFQAAFIAFLMGESLESFKQWKNLFILLTSCDDCMTERKDLFIDFVRKNQII